MSLLFNNMAQEANEQLECEFANAHFVFGGGSRTSAERRQQASAAILVWYSQVVAAQRRMAWDVKMQRKWPIALSDPFRLMTETGCGPGINTAPPAARCAYRYSAKGGRRGRVIPG